METETRELQSELGLELRQAIDVYRKTASHLASELPSAEFLSECSKRLGALLRLCDAELKLTANAAGDLSEPSPLPGKIAFPVTCPDGDFQLRLDFHLQDLSENARAELLRSLTAIMGDMVSLTSRARRDHTAAESESDLGVNLVTLSQPDWRVERVTASASRRFGIKPGERFCEDISTADYQQCLRDFLQEATGQRTNGSKRFMLRRGDDGHLAVEITIVEGRPGEVVCVLNSATDISHSAGYIPAAASEKLAHRLRNPLTTILSCCSQLLDSPPADCSVDRNTLIGWIDAAAEAQNSTIDRYLMLYGPAQTSVQSVNLNKFLSAVLTEFESSNNVKLQVSLPAEESQIKIDPYLGRQMLMELLQNALDVAPEGDIEIMSDTGNERASIRIKNQAGGLQSDFAKHFAEPFYTTKPSHTGLGLAIAKRYASIFGGELRLIAQDEATVIEVALPLAPLARSNPDPERT